jgi:hypothetical protein
LRRKCASEKVVCCCCCCCCCASCDFARFVRFLTRWTRTGFRFIFIFRKMRLLMENIKPVREPGATGFIFIFIFRKGWLQGVTSQHARPVSSPGCISKYLINISSEELIVMWYSTGRCPYVSSSLVLVHCTCNCICTGVP